MKSGLLVVALLAGCFPHHPGIRNAALATEGATLVAGLVVTAITPKPQFTCSSGNNDGIFGGSCNTSHSNLESVGPALIVGGLVGLIVTAVGSHSDEQPRPKVPVAPPPPVVGSPGDGAKIAVTDAFAVAQRFATQHAIPLDHRRLRDAQFDTNARRWVFEWQDASDVTQISVHESGAVTALLPRDGWRAP
jgi:hypothetical protein